MMSFKPTYKGGAGSAAYAKVREYELKFNCIYEGLNAFLHSNGVTIDGESSFASAKYSTVAEYREKYRERMSDNALRMRAAARSYSDLFA